MRGSINDGPTYDYRACALEEFNVYLNNPEGLSAQAEQGEPVFLFEARQKFNQAAWEKVSSILKDGFRFLKIQGDVVLFEKVTEWRGGLVPAGLRPA